MKKTKIVRIYFEEKFQESIGQHLIDLKIEKTCEDCYYEYFEVPFYSRLEYGDFNKLYLIIENKKFLLEYDYTKLYLIGVDELGEYIRINIADRVDAIKREITNHKKELKELQKDLEEIEKL